MKLVKTYGRTAKAAAALIGSIEQRGAVSTAKVEPVVRKILTEVRRGGDAALRKCAAKFDGLQKTQSLLVSREEMEAAWLATSPELQAAMMVARGNILAFAEAQMPKEWMISPADGVGTGQIVRPVKQCWLLCSGRPLSAAFDAVDDSDACAGGWRGAHRDLFAEACARDACGCLVGWRDGVLSRWERRRLPRLLWARRRLRR